jgi:PAS domain S-box-containing protein
MERLKNTFFHIKETIENKNSFNQIDYTTRLEGFLLEFLKDYDKYLYFKNESEFNSYYSIFDDLPAMLCEFLDDSTLVYVNKLYCEYFGLARKDLLGKKFLDFIPESERASAKKTYISLTPENPINTTTHRVEKENQIFWHEWRDRAIFDEENRVLKYRSIGIDITERKLTLEKMQEMTDTLSELNKNKDRFIQILTHDLKNPFNSLIGLLDILTENFDEYDSYYIKDKLKLLNDLSLQTYNLLNDLLIWSKSQSGKFNPQKTKINLNDLIEEVVSNKVIFMNEKKISLINHIDKKLNIDADKNMMSAIFRNLINNAIKFSYEGGVIEIFAYCKDKIVNIELIDSGIGISEENLKKINNEYEIFSTFGTNKEKGSGFGLNIVKDFVTMQNGSMQIESKPNLGTKIKIQISGCNTNSQK